MINSKIGELQTSVALEYITQFINHSKTEDLDSALDAIDRAKAHFPQENEVAGDWCKKLQLLEIIYAVVDSEIAKRTPLALKHILTSLSLIYPMPDNVNIGDGKLIEILHELTLVNLNEQFCTRLYGLIQREIKNARVKDAQKIVGRITNSTPSFEKKNIREEALGLLNIDLSNVESFKSLTPEGQDFVGTNVRQILRAILKEAQSLSHEDERLLQELDALRATHDRYDQFLQDCAPQKALGNAKARFNQNAYTLVIKLLDKKLAAFLAEPTIEKAQIVENLILNLEPLGRELAEKELSNLKKKLEETADAIYDKADDKDEGSLSFHEILERIEFLELAIKSYSYADPDKENSEIQKSIYNIRERVGDLYSYCYVLAPDAEKGEYSAKALENYDKASDFYRADFNRDSTDPMYCISSRENMGDIYYKKAALAGKGNDKDGFYDMALAIYKSYLDDAERSVDPEGYDAIKYREKKIGELRGNIAVFHLACQSSPTHHSFFESFSKLKESRAAEMTILLKKMNPFNPKFSTHFNEFMIIKSQLSHIEKMLSQYASASKSSTSPSTSTRTSSLETSTSLLSEAQMKGLVQDILHGREGAREYFNNHVRPKPTLTESLFLQEVKKLDLIQKGVVLRKDKIDNNGPKTTVLASTQEKVVNYSYGRDKKQEYARYIQDVSRFMSFLPPIYWCELIKARIKIRSAETPKEQIQQENAEISVLLDALKTMDCWEAYLLHAKITSCGVAHPILRSGLFKLQESLKAKEKDCGWDSPPDERSLTLLEVDFSRAIKYYSKAARTKTYKAPELSELAQEGLVGIFPELANASPTSLQRDSFFLAPKKVTKKVTFDPDTFGEEAAPQEFEIDHQERTLSEDALQVISQQARQVVKRKHSELENSSQEHEQGEVTSEDLHQSKVRRLSDPRNTKKGPGLFSTRAVVITIDDEDELYSPFSPTPAN